MPTIHERCKWIYTENFELSIEHQICYLDWQFYSGSDAQVIYLHVIGI